MIKTLLAIVMAFVLTVAVSNVVLGQTSTPSPVPTTRVVPTGAPSTGFGF